MGLSSDGSYEGQEINLRVMGECDGESDRTPRPKKMMKVACKILSMTGTQALARQESLPSPSASQADLLKKYLLPGNLKAVSRLVLKFYSRSLKMYTSGERPSNSSSAGSEESSRNHSSGHY